MNSKFGRRKLGLALALALTVSAPAHALGLGDLAKVVLSNGATVQKAADSCANTVTLAPADLLTLSIARQAAEQALPGAQFLALDTAANSQAATQAQAPGFCTTTAKKKVKLLDAIKRAGQKLVTARVLGL